MSSNMSYNSNSSSDNEDVMREDIDILLESLESNEFSDSIPIDLSIRNESIHRPSNSPPDVIESQESPPDIESHESLTDVIERQESPPDIKSHESPTDAIESQESPPAIESHESPTDAIESHESPIDDIESPHPENNTYIKEELVELAQQFKDKEILPDLVAQLIMNKKMNRMILDLYDYDEGFAISFNKYGAEEEIFHGNYSYAVSLIEYISDGEIPYEIFDHLSKYDFKIIYDGYIACQLRIHFEQKDSMRSHFVLLKHTIQTVVAECSINCKNDETLDFETEKARLICQYSPDLCLDPDPVVAEIAIANVLNQLPFISPYLKHFIKNEKARREKGVIKMKENSKGTKIPQDDEENQKKPKDYDSWSFRLRDPTPEEAELAQSESKLKIKPSIDKYLRNRKICFPDHESFTGFHVEIENFVYKYEARARDGTVETKRDQLHISVLDDKELYYCAVLLEMKEDDKASYTWIEVGDTREDLNLLIDSFTKEEMRRNRGRVEITHNRLFDERVEVSDGKATFVRRRLDTPASIDVLSALKPRAAATNES